MVVYHRGLYTKAAFLVFVFVPCVVASAAGVHLCLESGKPLVVAVAVIAACFFIVDHFAYYAFCEIAVTPEGLVYTGGGVLWRRVRKEKLLRWQDYIYVLIMVGARYAGLYVYNRKECASRGVERPFREGRVPPTLLSNVRASAPSEFNAFVREIRRHNPDVIIEASPALRIDHGG
jgi:hypothetical protein